MPRKGDRRKIAKNVYDDGTGRAITYTDPVTHKQKELRFPFFAPITEMRAAVERAKAEATTTRRVPARGTLAWALEQWEPLERGLASWRERRAELRAWLTALGDVRLAAITPRDCRRTMSAWLAAGVAPKTVRHRRWSLQHLYRVLHGPHTVTPVDDVPPPPKVKTIPVPVDPGLVVQVCRQLLEQEQRGLLRDAKTRARFMVRAATGKRPSEIMRAQPGDVQLARREWRVRDGKGGWSEGLYLNDDMCVAWRVFIQADAWGPFNTGSMAKVLRTAGWPHGLRPYELRHSVGIALSDAGVDLADIAGVLGHKDLRTTRQTYVPIRQARMQRASEAIDHRFAGWDSGTVPESGAEPRGTTRKNADLRLSPSPRGKRARSQGRR